MKFIDCTVDCRKCGVIGDHLTERAAEALATRHERSKGKGEHEVWWTLNYSKEEEHGADSVVPPVHEA